MSDVKNRFNKSSFSVSAYFKFLFSASKRSFLKSISSFSFSSKAMEDSCICFSSLAIIFSFFSIRSLSFRCFSFKASSFRLCSCRCFFLLFNLLYTITITKTNITIALKAKIPTMRKFMIVLFNAI